MITEDTLVYDIETLTYGKPDSKKDRLKIFGCYSYIKKKPYLLTSKEEIQTITDAHKIMVGFSNVGTKIVPGYDNPILIREGINMEYKIFIDLKNIIKERASQMKIKKGMLGDLLMEYKLDYIVKMLDIVDEEHGKIEIDYKKFQTWTPEETEEIKKYTRRDILITKKLYEWVENYFAVFKPFLNEEDVKKKRYLTCSIAKFGYKAICKAMNWNESYNTKGDSGHKIGGGYVAYPAGERYEGLIFCFDFDSLYPNIIAQCNLHNRQKILDTRPTWNGGDVWDVEGKYYSDKLGGIGELIIKWFNQRKELKAKGDRREYTIKIILNAAMYGLLNNAYYEKMFDRIAGGDCTRIGRQWTKFARKKFKEAGYEVIYTDTDSVYIKDPFNDKERMLKVRDDIINGIKATVPFPSDTFNMGIDDEIKYMYFFKGQSKDDKDSDKEMDTQDIENKKLGLLKKNYIYVTKDDRVVIKNLGIKKKSNSLLSRKIFQDYLVPKIKKGEIKFSKTYIRNIIIDLLEKDVNLASMRKDVGNYEQYRETSPGCISAQITKKYGSGIHFMIPNKRGVGVGKGKQYCTVEEFKAHNLNIDHIDLDNVWKELDYFLKPVITKGIFDF